MMALSLGVSRGSKIQIGHLLVQVEAVYPPNAMVVTCEGKAHHVTDLERVKLAESVYLSYGKSAKDNGHHPQASGRLAIEAPKSIKITRL
jgi:hypothetical protein